MRRDNAGAGDDDIYVYSSGGLAAVVGLGGSGRLHYWNGTFHDTGIAWVALYNDFEVAKKVNEALNKRRIGLSGGGSPTLARP